MTSNHSSNTEFKDSMKLKSITKSSKAKLNIAKIYH